VTDIRTDLPGRPDDDPEPVRDEKEIARELRLRPEPPRVVRLSRKALGLLAGVAMAGVGGALLFALRPVGEADQREELFSTDNRQPADQLAQLPRDYSSVPRPVPQLGPPLPGDLGRPMLNAGVEPQPGETPPGAVPPPPAPTPPDPEAQRREQEWQRRLQEIEAARTSRLFAAETRTEAAPGQPLAAVEGAEAGSAAAAAPEAPRSPPSGGDRHLAFLNGPAERRTASVERVQPAPGRNTLQAGSVISAALITELRSDLPGQVTAQVTEHVYDSVTGRTLLVPQGARLIGQYDAEVAFGQSRALLVWARLIFPDGRSIVLERQPAADAQGRAGLQDRVDRRWGELFRAGAVSTLLGVASELAAGDDEDRLVQALRRGAQKAIDDAGQQLVRRSLNVEPTLTVRPGYPVRVILTRDLVLEPWEA